MFSTYTPNDYISYKKLARLLESNFGYSLQSALIGKRSITDVINFRSDIAEQQALISESSYEYSNEKYRKNVIILEALTHLVKLLEIRTYRIDPKSGALVNYKTQEEKQETLANPKDNRPDLYFTQDHLNIEEPIEVVGDDANDVVASVTNAANQVAPEDNLKKAEVYVGVNGGDPNYSTPTNTALETELAGLSSGDLLNLTDKVKKEVKKDLAKEISDAALLAKRKNEEQKLGESAGYNAESPELDRYIAVAYDTNKDEGKRFYVRAYTEEEAIQFAKDHAKKLHKASVFVETDNGNEIFNGSIKEQKINEAIAEKETLIDEESLPNDRYAQLVFGNFTDQYYINVFENLTHKKVKTLAVGHNLEQKDALHRFKNFILDAHIQVRNAINYKAKKANRQQSQEQKLGEGNMSHKILSKLLESEMEKAEIVLGVKAITDDLQQMAEKISRMQIEDMAALTERLKAEFGIERGDSFQAEVGGFLGTALMALQASKSSIDNTALALTGDSGMAASGTSPAPAPLPAPDEVSDELPGGEEADMFVGHEAGAGPEEAPLGRAKKESVTAKHNKLLEMKLLVQKFVGKLEEMKNDPTKRTSMLNTVKKLQESVTLIEAWEAEMHTKEKDKGMFKGKPQAKIKSELSNLKDRQEAHKEKHGKADPEISKKIKQHEFALRAKHNFGKVNEAETCSEDGSKQLLMDEGAIRKHFRDVANTLKHVSDKEKRKELAKSHADAFKKMNPRFNHSKFYKACDLEECGDVGLNSPLSMSTKNFESTEPRKMGNPEHMAKKEVNPKTPSDTSKCIDDTKVGSLKKK